MRQFPRNFWVFLLSGVFWSLGLMTFFLVYNLHLLDLGFNEQVVGKIASAVTLGSMAITLVTGRLLNRYGVNRVIQFCVVATAILLAWRTLVHGTEWMIATAFLNGASIAGWMVAAPPFISRNTDPETRTWAFSLSYGSSIGTGALAGLIVGFVARDLSLWAWVQELTGLSVKQCVLLTSSCSVLLGFFGLLFLREQGTVAENTQPSIPLVDSTLLRIKNRRFVVQLLASLALWSFFVGSFPPFFNVFFHKQFKQSLDGIGIIFSISQLCQVAAVLCMPWLVMKLGRVRAISSAQFASALMLPILTAVTSVHTAGVIYLAYLSLQVMVEPALESFVMDSVFPEERNTVASLRYMTLFSVQALAVLASGFAIARFGYSSLLVALALLGIAAAAAFYSSFQLRKLPVPDETNVPAICPFH